MKPLVKVLSTVLALVCLSIPMAGCDQAKNTKSPTVAKWSDIPFARIVAENGSSTKRSLGSGTLVDVNGKFGLIFTCNHVTKNGGPYWIRFADGSEYAAEYLTSTTQNDISALKIARPDKAPVTMGAFTGRGTYTAYGFDGDEKLATVAGKVIDVYGEPGSYDHSYVGISAFPLPGDSGSGTLDDNGKFVGVLWGYNPKGGLVTCGKPVTDFSNDLVAAGLWQPSANFTPGGQYPTTEVVYEENKTQEVSGMLGKFGSLRKPGDTGGGKGGDGGCPNCRRGGGGGEGGRTPFGRHAVDDPAEVVEAVVNPLGLDTLQQAVLLGAGLGLVGALFLYFNRYHG